MAEAVKAGSDYVTDVTDSFSGEDAECKICYNDFDRDRRAPKILECSHTFCQACLDSVHVRDGRGWRIGCPLCRHRTPVPEYHVRNLPDNSAVTDALPVTPRCLQGDSVSAETADHSAPAPDLGPGLGVTVQETHDHRSQTCKEVAFTTGCVCVIFSFVSMVVLLFLGLVFVHNFSNIHSAFGPLCLFGASVLALFTLVLTWLMCLLKYRPETEAGHLSPLSSYYVM